MPSPELCAHFYRELRGVSDTFGEERSEHTFGQCAALAEFCERMIDASNFDAGDAWLVTVGSRRRSHCSYPVPRSLDPILALLSLDTRSAAQMFCIHIFSTHEHRHR